MTVAAPLRPPTTTSANCDGVPTSEKSGGMSGSRAQHRLMSACAAAVARAAAL